MTIKDPGKNKPAARDDVAAALLARSRAIAVRYAHEAVDLLTLARALGALGVDVPLDGADVRVIATLAATKVAHGFDATAELARLRGAAPDDGLVGTYVRFALGRATGDDALVEGAVTRAVEIVRAAGVKSPMPWDAGQVFVSMFAHVDGGVDAIERVRAAYGRPLLPIAEGHRTAARVRAGLTPDADELESGATHVAFGHLDADERRRLVELALAQPGGSVPNAQRRAHLLRELRRGRADAIAAISVDFAALSHLAHGDVERARALTAAPAHGQDFNERAAVRLLLLDPTVERRQLAGALATAVQFAGPRRPELDAHLARRLEGASDPVEQTGLLAARAALLDDPKAAAQAFAAVRGRFAAGDAMVEMFEKAVVPLAIGAGQLAEAARAAARSRYDKAALLADVGVAFAQRGDLGGVVEVIAALPKSITLDELARCAVEVAHAMRESPPRA